MDGTNHIREWALNEGSLVTLPCNENCMVEARAKMNKSVFKSMSYKDAKNFLLREKGMHVAGRIHNALWDLAWPEDGEPKDRHALEHQIISRVVTATGKPEAEVLDVFHGDTIPSEDIVRAFAEALALNGDEMVALNEADRARIGGTPPAEPPPAGEGEADKGGMKPNEEKPADKSKKPKANKADDPMTPPANPPPAEPGTMGGEGDGGFEGLETQISQFEAEVAATEGDGEGNPAAWIADEAKWARAKEASREAYGEVRYPFVVWFYLNVLDGGKKAYGDPTPDPKDPKSKADGAPEGGEPPPPPEPPNELQRCVESKLPALVESGLTQEEAVAAALEQCQADGKCKIGSLRAKDLIFLAQKMSKQDGDPTVNLSDVQNPADFGNPYLDIAKTQTALLGEAVTKLTSLVEGMTNLANVMNQGGIANQNNSTQNQPNGMDSGNGNEDPNENEDAELLLKASKIRDRIKARWESLTN
jgi:hypothetical protein